MAPSDNINRLELYANWYLNAAACLACCRSSWIW